MKQIKYFVRENTHMKREMGLDFGWGNGYVILPAGHIFHGNTMGIADCSVHGGLTYSEIITREMIDSPKWPQLMLEDEGSWIIGFDTFHNGDSLEQVSREYVERELLSLVAQIVKRA
jgi:hypothetical protein